MNQAKIKIRKSKTQNLDSLRILYPAAFPDENLSPLISELLTGRDDVLSLVATVNTDVVGHVIYTLCGTETSDARLALLGPLEASPDWQQNGTGTKLVEEGIARLKCKDVTIVCVLGVPAYYGRLGFAVESHVMPPYKPPMNGRIHGSRSNWKIPVNHCLEGLRFLNNGSPGNSDFHSREIAHH